MLLEFLRWWYGPGWLEIWHKAGQMVINTQRAFSAGVLLRTLFAPWKRIVSVPGGSIGEKFQTLIDNLVSRTVGFFVRLLTLIASLFITLFAAVFGYLLAVVWPLLPLVSLYLIWRGFSG